MKNLPSLQNDCESQRRQSTEISPQFLLFAHSAHVRSVVFRETIVAARSSQMAVILIMVVDLVGKLVGVDQFLACRCEDFLCGEDAVMIRHVQGCRTSTGTLHRLRAVGGGWLVDKTEGWTTWAKESSEASTCWREMRTRKAGSAHAGSRGDDGVRER